MAKTLTLPIAYAQLVLDVAHAQGLDQAALLDGLELKPETLRQADARLPMETCARLLLRVMHRSDNPAIGYDIGLHSNLRTHGLVGLGVLSLPTLREALDFGARFINLRTPFLRIETRVDGDTAAVLVEESLPLGPLRDCCFDLFLVGMWRISQSLTVDAPAARSLATLEFDRPQPTYFPAYRDRLPPVRFNACANRIVFPVGLLDRPLGPTDRGAAETVQAQLERERSLLPVDDGSIGPRVMALLQQAAPTLPSLPQAAGQLHLSPRSLKRRLHKEGLLYSELLAGARAQAACTLLESTPLSVAGIAERLGYRDPANFTRAFRRWTGRCPSAWRRDAGTP